MTATPSLGPEDARRGATIKALREAHGLSAAELGRLIGVSRARISQIELGQKRATIANCKAIADKLHIPLAAITIEGYEHIADAKAAS